MPVADDLILEDAQVIFRNFQGREQQFNSLGDRNFCVILDPKMAENLKRQGWNVKELRAREEGEEPKPYIQVAVNYGKGRPPRVVILTQNGTRKTDLGADEVELLDYADVKTWDLVINPYQWEVRENKGVKGYLKHAFVTLNENALELKYAHLDEQDPTSLPSSTANEED